MASSSSYRLIFIFSLLLAFTYVNAWIFCNDNKKINSTKMSSNIDHILPKLVSQTSVQGYTFLSSGSGNDRVYGELDNSNGVVYASVENVTGDDAAFEKIVAEIKYTATTEALDRNIKIEFGKWEMKLSEFETLYTVVQCTRDLSKLACSQCLATAVENFAGFCKDKKGCRAIYSSCFVRYELYPIVYPGNSANSTARNAYSRHMLHP
ncbi:hypothetical protein C5167_040183 [Papaver somniferum]|uniref:Gnk2-homologous domain-containing protein n=1 Tax=Papaver somniferum TaxID=3469 RepID=A0A4Y7IHQ1_PAPSO|nr:hypothetical protein C5167_040183 [Papaver somniferum]